MSREMRIGTIVVPIDASSIYHTPYARMTSIDVGSIGIDFGLVRVI